MNKKQKKVLVRILVSAVLVIFLSLLPLQGLPAGVLFLVPYLIIGYDILKKAVKGVRNRQPFDENFLMAVATVGAIALGDYREGVAVMLFYQIGELFQGYAVGKSRRSISQLMDIRPDYANVRNEQGELEQVDPDEVEVGTVIVVQPGEKVPIDGTVVSGSATLNTAALTGESAPREVAPGDEVISGCINDNGVLEIKTTRPFGESTVSRILELVENASSRKSRSEAFISKFARYYTPAVCYSALALALLPPVVRLLIGLPAQPGVWVYRALTFLVISCPCAVVISVPLSFFAGIGGASSAGVLIKGSNYMETLSRVTTVVFDKTGTLTQGVFRVTKVCPEGMTEQQLIEYAALAESYSSHPISLSLKHAYGSEIDPSRVTEVNQVPGRGITARVDGTAVAAGNARLMADLGITPAACDEAGTVVHVAVGSRYAGYLLITDEVKPDSAAAMERLRSSGITHTVMLTGDRRQAAEQVAARLGIQTVYAELLPADKVARVEELLASEGPKNKLAFVGDGINDAPVLSRADVGIAMGAMGSDAAIEAADVVLMDDNPLKIVKAIRISRKCLAIVRQNIAFALGVKGLCLILGALGIANMWAAIFADVGVMVIAVLNAIRALNVKNL